ARSTPGLNVESPNATTPNSTIPGINKPPPRPQRPLSADPVALATRTPRPSPVASTPPSSPRIGSGGPYARGGNRTARGRYRVPAGGTVWFRRGEGGDPFIRREPRGRFRGYSNRVRRPKRQSDKKGDRT